ncbi:MAG: large conductance mechanosensitive channel protein MscL [Patescibacteria group bacterium]
MIFSAKNLAREFKEFALRGNVIDLAVGIIVGAGFNNLVNSLVKNIVLPPIGLALNKVNFSNLYFDLSRQDFKSLADAEQAGAPVLKYGLFINDVISFIITAFVVFMLVRWMNALHRRRNEGNEEIPTTKPCPFCMSVIPIKATRCPQCTSQIS